MPDSTSLFYIGGSNTGGTGCKCELSQVRFYKDLVVDDESVIQRFSGYQVGNTHSLTTINDVFYNIFRDNIWIRLHVSRRYTSKYWSFQDIASFRTKLDWNSLNNKQ